MATGAGYYDAEGVWIYGENDHIALFSDLLNLGENSVSDQFTLDRSRITAVEASLGVRYAAASSTARDAHFGVPANDTQRLALQNSGAECGATPAGWYPAAGQSVTGGLIRNATAVTIATASSITLTSGFDIGFSTGVTVTAGSTPSITIPATGLYQVNSLLTWASGAGSTVRYLWVTKNTSANATPTAAQTVISYIVQPAGDVLRLCVNQASGASLTLVDNASGSGVNQGLSIQWIGAQR
jgi:hypothetical protein